MIKLLVFVHKHPNMDFDAFRKYYEGKHVPLVARKLKLMRRYVRNYFNPAGDMPRPCDCVAELWFDDMDALARQSEETGNDAEMEADELQFMDRARLTSFIVEECCS